MQVVIGESLCLQDIGEDGWHSAGTHVYNPHLPDISSTSSNVCKAGALVPSPPCLGEGPHGWVPVDTHSTPVLTSVRRLWVAYVLYEPNVHRNTRNPHMVAEQEFRTTTQKPASQPRRQHSGAIGTGHGCFRTDTESVSRTTESTLLLCS